MNTWHSRFVSRSCHSVGRPRHNQFHLLSIEFYCSFMLIALFCKASYGGIGDQLHKLLANDGASGDALGEAVAISDSFAITSSRSDEQGGAAGAAYVFDVTTGTQIAKLLPNDGEAGDLFGNSVALHDHIALIGAAFDNDQGGGLRVRLICLMSPAAISWQSFFPAMVVLSSILAFRWPPTVTSPLLDHTMTTQMGPNLDRHMFSMLVAARKLRNYYPRLGRPTICLAFPLE